MNEVVALDTNCLAMLSSPREGDKLNRARLEHLLDEVGKAGGRIIIPAPVFAEFLVGINEAASEWINEFDKRRHVLVAPFDRRAAFECSLLDKAALNTGDKKGGRPEPWQRIKVDRQIVAVAKVCQVTTIVTNDGGVRATAMTAGLIVRRLEELPLPDSARQHGLFQPTETRTKAAARRMILPPAA